MYYIYLFVFNSWFNPYRLKQCDFINSTVFTLHKQTHFIIANLTFMTPMGDHWQLIPVNAREITLLTQTFSHDITELTNKALNKINAFLKFCFKLLQNIKSKYRSKPRYTVENNRRQCVKRFLLYHLKKTVDD